MRQNFQLQRRDAQLMVFCEAVEVFDPGDEDDTA